MKILRFFDWAKLLQLFVVIYFTMAFISCDSKANKPKKAAENLETAISTEERIPVPDSITSFLLHAAATDFHTSKISKPLEFRNVKIGYQVISANEMQYVLCGEFLAQQKEEWMPFATIKTDPYEQWLGRQALSFCEEPAMIFENKNDLSENLKNRLGSL